MNPGMMINNAWEEDPKRLAFTFARYKHVAKLLYGLPNVIEVGANTGFASRIVSANVKNLVLSDIHPYPGVELWNPINGRFSKSFDASYALDVLEHIPKRDEDSFINGIAKSLNKHGTLIIGMPSLESQPYSTQGRKEHVNCKTEHDLRQSMLKHFQVVYLFGMNDETLHTGFGPMCHYRIALANTPRTTYEQEDR